MSYTTQDLIKRYVELRDAKEARAELEKKWLVPINSAMQAIENQLLLDMQQAECESIRTTEGTAFKSTSTRVHCADKEVFFDWVGENWTHRRVFLTAAVSKDTLKAYTDEGGDIPPGLDVKYETKIMVRRPT